jgi:hypothetical protein
MASSFFVENPHIHAPKLTSIDPTSAVVGGPDLTLTVHGTEFTSDCVIYFNGGAEPTEFVSETELTTTVKPSTASGPITVPVTVGRGGHQTPPVSFEFTEGGSS